MVRLLLMCHTNLEDWQFKPDDIVIMVDTPETSDHLQPTCDNIVSITYPSSTKVYKLIPNGE